ncbi:hypothetical protein Glove_139g124 [Diversispora epigaea]|uniref:Uncharacterized protein n=1 Tax=Diversispora epigaea TaxID=1348612 RepID=A0A397J4X9_9GLOM|nr:hypothetical protein Glove_139g124 [Diversispora epigaea]
MDEISNACSLVIILEDKRVDAFLGESFAFKIFQRGSYESCINIPKKVDFQELNVLETLIQCFFKDEKLSLVHLPRLTGNVDFLYRRSRNESVAGSVPLTTSSKNCLFSELGLT